ncbi:hypothetical protein [Streptomyces collinus]|uniref:hypothetical protein n=1 Tax=Streptomyces collinus TaxID=42684 RepID=UPI0034086F6B
MTSATAAARGGRPAPGAPVASRYLADRPPPATGLAYAGRMTVGLLVAPVAARHPSDRPADPPR